MRQSWPPICPLSGQEIFESLHDDLWPVPHGDLAARGITGGLAAAGSVA